MRHRAGRAFVYLAVNFIRTRYLNFGVVPFLVGWQGLKLFKTDLRPQSESSEIRNPEGLLFKRRLQFVRSYPRLLRSIPEAALQTVSLQTGGRVKTSQSQPLIWLASAELSVKVSELSSTPALR